MVASPQIGRKWLEEAIAEEKINLFENFSIGKRLGGTFSQAFQAEWNREHTSTRVVVKVLWNFEQEVLDEAIIKEITNELKFLRTTEPHHNILRFHGVGITSKNGHYMSVSEYADGGSLRGYLVSNFSKLTGEDKISLAREIAAGVSCLHDHNIVHRDLNSTNILVHQGHIKIADLGLSKSMDRGIAKSTSSSLPGYLQYIDPQCFLRLGYVLDQKSDVYSVGVVLWELTSGKIPFSRAGNLVVAHIISGKRETPTDGTPTEFVNLYVKCWNEDPEKRPGIHDVCKTLDGLKWTTGTPSIYRRNSIDIQSIADFFLGFNQFRIIRNNDTISEKVLKEIPWNNKLLDGATLILRHDLDLGEGYSQIKSRIGKYLEENNETPEGLLNMLVGENITKHPYALLLGFCYLHQIGTEASIAKAFEAFQVSAESGDSYGQYFLGLHYLDVFNNDSDQGKIKAFEWFEKSAKQGNPDAQRLLAYCYRTGEGTFKNSHQAFVWYKRSAESGNVWGQYELANYYRNGWGGIPKNIEKARQWFQKAANNKHTWSREALNNKSWQTEEDNGQ